MTVQQMIDWLATQPKTADVMLCDPDTGWWLPVRLDGYTQSPQPLGTVAVFASYDDHPTA